MAEFPSDLELTAASALLLLSYEASSASSMSKMEVDENRVEVAKKQSEKSEQELRNLETSSDTTTLCFSSLTVDDDSVQVQSREIKLKVARKARSKVMYKSWTDRKPTAPVIWKTPSLTKPKMKGEPSEATTDHGTTITTEGSCLSSGGSSEISSTRIRTTSRRPPPERGQRKGRPATRVAVVEGGKEMKRRGKGLGSFHIRTRAEAIKRMLLSGGCASEVRIRQVLGDSPDTSKALRMLLRMEEVKRTGAGGRSDPFIYKIQAEAESITSLKPQVPIA